jgi:YjbE family integral membrane protein
MMALLSSPQEFWIPLAQIIGINIVLSGDNAVVIALASRSLPPSQQKKAIVFGSAAAILMRIVLTLTAVALLSMPYLKLIGAVLLLWIGIQLISAEEGNDSIASSDNLGAAIKTILVADLVMSLDNVIAVAAAARGSFPLLIIGLAISIPLVIFGASMLLKLMERFPIIITIGAALLGYVGGEMAVTDPAIVDWIDHNFHALHQIVPLSCAAAIILTGRYLAARRASTGAALSHDQVDEAAIANEAEALKTTPVGLK